MTDTTAVRVELDLTATLEARAAPVELPPAYTPCDGTPYNLMAAVEVNVGRRPPLIPSS